MKHLYFANVPTIISTVLIVVFCELFGIILSKNEQINKWGLLVLAMFVLGLSMSILSGFKDGAGTPDALFAAGKFVVVAASILGGLVFLTGILALIIRRQEFWQISFYALSGIIILKTFLVEASRIALYLKKKAVGRSNPRTLIFRSAQRAPCREVRKALLLPRPDRVRRLYDSIHSTSPTKKCKMFDNLSRAPNFK